MGWAIKKPFFSITLLVKPLPKKDRSKSNIKVDAEPKGGKGTIRLIGLLMVLVAAASFVVNFGIWHPWLFAKITWLWNPLSLLTPRLVGHIWVLSSALAYVVNGIFAALYSAVLFVIGMFVLLH